MAISEKYKGRYIFHFTDMENLGSIIKNGLLCTNVKNERGIVHKNIARVSRKIVQEIQRTDCQINKYFVS